MYKKTRDNAQTKHEAVANAKFADDESRGERKRGHDI